MSTRALAKIYDDDGKTVITAIYKHWDGYPEGFGADLEKFASKFTLVNGIPGGADKRVVANGMSCFAASLIKEFKDEAGDVYIFPPDARDVGEEYTYHVKPDGGKITVTCESKYGEDEDEE
jgi:hypothetical protein